MSFWQQVISTFIGALAGFLFSILLFYFTERWKNSQKKRNLNFNILKECEYDIDFLEKFKSDFEKACQQITINDKNIFIIFRFSKLQRLFILSAFNEGLLYKNLTVEEIGTLDSMLNYFNFFTDNYLIERLEQFKKDGIGQMEALGVFNYNKDEIVKYLNFIKVLKEKLKKF